MPALCVLPAVPWCALWVAVWVIEELLHCTVKSKKERKKKKITQRKRVDVVAPAKQNKGKIGT